VTLHVGPKKMGGGGLLQGFLHGSRLAKLFGYSPATVRAVGALVQTHFETKATGTIAEVMLGGAKPSVDLTGDGRHAAGLGQAARAPPFFSPFSPHDVAPDWPVVEPGLLGTWTLQLATFK